jgi:hypothetical protein
MNTATATAYLAILGLLSVLFLVWLALNLLTWAQHGIALHHGASVKLAEIIFLAALALAFILAPIVLSLWQGG